MPSSAILERVKRKKNRVNVSQTKSQNGKFNDVRLRFLCHTDFPEVKRLCHELFPVEYPDIWYEDIICSCRFYSLAAVYKKRIVGILVAENKGINKLNKEEKSILSEIDNSLSNVAYILTLGVSVEVRRRGIASLLLDCYMQFLEECKIDSIKVVILHVLTTNEAAIKFYEKKGFLRRSFIPCYYTIKNKSKDAFSYIRYINGGKKPQSLPEYLYESFVSLSLWDILWWPLRFVSRFLALGSQQATFQ